jgi:hypothetical protein
MRRFRNLVLYLLIPLLAFAGIYRVATSNEQKLYLPSCEKSDVAAIRRLDELVRDNSLNRKYYQVFVKTDSGNCCIVRYNTEYEALWISVDPASGWVGAFELPRERLKFVAEKGFTFPQLGELLLPLPEYKRAGSQPE